MLRACASRAQRARLSGSYAALLCVSLLFAAPELLLRPASRGTKPLPRPWSVHEAIERLRGLPYWPTRLASFAATQERWAASADPGADKTTKVACWQSPLAANISERLVASLPRDRPALAQCRLAKAVLIVEAPEDCPPGRLCAATHSVPSAAVNTTVARTQELGFELINAVPWAYFQSLNGTLALSGSVADSFAFYFASTRHCERETQRVWRTSEGFGSPWPARGVGLMPVPERLGAAPLRHPLKIAGWAVPPFRAWFCGWGLLPPAMARRPYVFVYNKRNLFEWGKAPVNFLADSDLEDLFDALADRGVGLVYHRATPELFASETLGFGADESDFDALRAAAERRFGSLAAAYGAEEQRLAILPELLVALRAEAGESTPEPNSPNSADLYPFSANSVQLAVMADAAGYIAVQGGPAYLSLLWGPGRRVLLLQRKGAEVESGASRLWFGALTGSDVVSTDSGAELVWLAREERWLGAQGD